MQREKSLLKRRRRMKKRMKMKDERIVSALELIVRWMVVIVVRAETS